MHFETSGQQTELKWYEYSNKYKSYIPVSEPTDKVSFFLAIGEKDKVLRLEVPKGSSLFMDNRLLKSNILDDVFQLSLDSLAGMYSQDSAFFTIYHPVSLKGLKSTTFTRGSNLTSGLNVQVRPSTAASDFFIFAIVVMLLFGAILKKVTTPQIAYLLGVRQLYQYQTTEGPLYGNSFFSQESTFYYLFISFIIGLFGVYYADSLQLEIDLLAKDTFLNYLLQWVAYSLVVYLFFYVRFIIYKILSGIYNFRRYLMVQNYDFMRVSLVISVGFLALMIIDLFLTELTVWWQAIMGGTLLIIYISTTFRKLNKLYSHTKLHLFSYLCVSELVPWIFLLGNLRN
ncbi:MAG: DUF4271 domain-containing protein [Bacteroidota bacterium]